MATNQTGTLVPIAGFWRRFGAFFIDCLLLGIIGLGLGQFFTQELVSLGPWGRLLGFSVAFVYFGLLNSKLANGQTLGKRLLNIKVVTAKGDLVSVAKSLMRFIPLSVPWFLNNAQFSESALSSFWGYLLSVAIFGIGFSIVYLFVFNRRTRQSLHDLLVGSYVVSANAQGGVPYGDVWRVHWIVCGILIVVSGAAPYFLRGFTVKEPFSSLLRISRMTNAEPGVVNARVSKGKSFVTSVKNGRKDTSYLAVIAYLNTPDIKSEERATTLAKLSIAADVAIGQVDVVHVTLSYGYDIGIASSWRSQTYSHSPQEWAAK